MYQIHLYLFFYTVHMVLESEMHPHALSAIKQELNDWHLWGGRGVVLAFAALAGCTVVLFTWMTEHALAVFFDHRAHWPWMPLLWTPLSAAAIVALTRRFAPGAAGSGIPQVMASLSPTTPPALRGMFVSVRLSAAKMLLSTWGLLAGLSLGREGPSVQVAAGVMHHARRWMPARAQVSDHGLLTAGGAAGIAAAFNTPLGGVMFAIEELSKHPEHRHHGLLLAAIVLGGLMGVSAYGNATYFGVIQVQDLGWPLFWPALLVTLTCGLAGGLFSRLLVVSLSGTSHDALSRMRSRFPVRFAALCGLVVAVMGWVTQGETFGSGYAHTRFLLEGQADTNPLTVLLKFMATWLTAWSGVPGGIFAPSLSIGGAMGYELAGLTSYGNTPTLIALGMAAFLAAVTQAPLTSFIIVMEMVTGHAMVLSLMASALVASGMSRLVSAPLYASLAQLQLQRLPGQPHTTP